MEQKSGSHRDPIEFTAGSLGKAKTNAESIGAKLVTEFRHVEELVDKARGQGIVISALQFEDPVVQAAWQAHRGHENGPPMMDTEEELVNGLRRVG